MDEVLPTGVLIVLSISMAVPAVVCVLVMLRELVVPAKVIGPDTVVVVAL